MNDKMIQQRLLAMQQEVLAKLPDMDGISYQTSEGCPDCVSEQQVDITDLKLLFSLDVESRQRLNRINHALNRLHRKEYRRCANCGSTLPEERLELLPLTDLCEGCEATTLSNQPLH